MAQVLQVVINGILLGGIYALLGVGMTMMFGIVKLTNLAHGEFVIIGSYASTLIAQAIGVDPILTQGYADRLGAGTAGNIRSFNYSGRRAAAALLSGCTESKCSL